MNDLQPLRDLFDITSGHTVTASDLRPVPPGDGIAYVTRTHRNNGVAGWTAPLRGLTPAEAGTLTVCLRSRNHSLAAFVQPVPYYTTYHVAVLNPRRTMGLAEKLWWCRCIQLNRFRFNFGRQANRTLGNLLVPTDVPDGVHQLELPPFELTRDTDQVLGTDDWTDFQLTDLFTLTLGRNEVRRALPPGATPYVSGSGINNGISARVTAPAEFPGGVLTVANNGSVGASFLQPDPFVASIDVTVLQPKFEMSPATGLFICAVIKHEAKRYNYARKWTLERMNSTSLRLPATEHGALDCDRIHRIVRTSGIAQLAQI